jgi:hypothetical protein
MYVLLNILLVLTLDIMHKNQNTLVVSLEFVDNLKLTKKGTDPVFEFSRENKSKNNRSVMPMQDKSTFLKEDIAIKIDLDLQKKFESLFKNDAEDVEDNEVKESGIMSTLSMMVSPRNKKKDPPKENVTIPWDTAPPQASDSQRKLQSQHRNVWSVFSPNRSPKWCLVALPFVLDDNVLADKAITKEGTEKVQNVNLGDTLSAGTQSEKVPIQQEKKPKKPHIYKYLKFTTRKDEFLKKAAQEKELKEFQLRKLKEQFCNKCDRSNKSCICLQGVSFFFFSETSIVRQRAASVVFHPMYANYILLLTIGNW